VVAIVRDGATIIPRGDDRIEVGDKLKAPVKAGKE
jgi:Trk K+ transport system NAD-binding subunit